MVAFIFALMTMILSSSNSYIEQPVCLRIALLSLHCENKLQAISLYQNHDKFLIIQVSSFNES